MENNNVNILNSNVLKIEKNVIEMDSSIIQLRNVTSVSLRIPPKNSYNIYVILGFFLGFPLLFSGGGSTIFGLVLLVTCGFLLFKVWDSNSDLGKNIIISTNSGLSFWINSKDDKFSMTVINVIKNLMNGMNQDNTIVINLDKRVINNTGNIIEGDIVNSTVNKDSTSYSDINNSLIGDNIKVNTESQEDIPELRI